ncbi:MAG TPA: leucine-rich repeat domain-containing protein, partial [Lentisphaeria bacterium]|nr:leucine-rich repeat domain-containing protein [Lentisphaeria bacterium]
MNSRFRLFGICLLVLVMLGGRQMQAQTLDEALNVPGGTLEFTTFSSPEAPPYPWTVVTEPEATHDGGAAARSGAVGYYYPSGTYVRSILNTTLTGSGLLTFWTKGTGRCELYIRKNNAGAERIDTSWVSDQDGEWRFHRQRLRDNQNTVQWRFENRQYGSQPGQTEHYFLLDEVRWYPADEQGYVFQLNEDGVSYALLAYMGQAVELNVPATFAGKPVTVIGEEAFADQGRPKAVVLPEGLRRIEANAFSYSSLVSVTLPSTLQYIGERAFYGSDLEQVVLPSGLTEIGESAFRWCDLTSIVFADRNGKDIT